MLNIKIHEFAQQELNEAIQWYDLQFVGLGNNFKKIVVQQIQKIAKNPSWFLQDGNDIYKAYTPKFPYKILFSYNKSALIIWAIAHLHRKPNYWQSRYSNKNKD